MMEERSYRKTIVWFQNLLWLTSNQNEQAVVESQLFLFAEATGAQVSVIAP